MEITKGPDKITFDGQREINIRFLTRRGADMMDVKSKKLTPEILYRVMYPSPWPEGRAEMFKLLGVILLAIAALVGLLFLVIAFINKTNGGELNALNLLIHSSQPRGLLGGDYVIRWTPVLPPGFLFVLKSFENLIMFIYLCN